MVFDELKKAIETKRAKIGVIGLGHAGLPLAVLFAKSGFKVAGFDLNKNKVELVNNSKSCYVDCVADEEVAQVVTGDNLIAYTDFSKLGDLDIILIAIPTLLSKQETPNLHALYEVSDSVAQNIHGTQLIILESTVYPGATEEVLKKALDSEGKVLEKDYFLAYSPSRIDPGNKDWPLEKVPKIIGGADKGSTELAKDLYTQVIDAQVYESSSIKTAEMTKLFENSFRAINIAFVTSMKMDCELFNIDIWEVIELATTKPYGYMPFYPGPGIGGDCIPTVPLYIAWKVREMGKRSHFIELASEINDTMPYYVINRLDELLNKHKKPLDGSKILVIGVAFKKDIADTNNTPAAPIMQKLSEKGAEVSFHDPNIDTFKVGPTVFASRKLNEKTLDEADAVLIITNHSNIDYKLIAEKAKLVYDTRNALKDYKNKNIYR